LLGENCIGDGSAPSFQDDVGGCWYWSVVVANPETELQEMVVGGSLVAEIPLVRQKVHRFVPTRCDSYAVNQRNVLHLDVPLVLILSPPPLRTLGERRLDQVAGVPPRRHTLRRVSVAEARRAPELVLQIKIEEPRFALSAPLPFDVLLAEAGAAVGVAVGLVVGRARFRAAAALAPAHAEVVVVDGAPVALLPGHSGLALALPLGVALQAPGADLVAFARDAIAVRVAVVLLAAAFAVRPITVRGAVQAVASVAGQAVQLFVVEAAIGETVAIAFCK
jgi:hypothetical protein